MLLGYLDIPYCKFMQIRDNFRIRINTYGFFTDVSKPQSEEIRFYWDLLFWKFDPSSPRFYLYTFMLWPCQQFVHGDVERFHFVINILLLNFLCVFYR